MDGEGRGRQQARRVGGNFGPFVYLVDSSVMYVFGLSWSMSSNHMLNLSVKLSPKNRTSETRTIWQGSWNPGRDYQRAFFLVRITDAQNALKIPFQTDTDVQ